MKTKVPDLLFIKPNRSVYEPALLCKQSNLGYLGRQINAISTQNIGIRDNNTEKFTDSNKELKTA